MNKVVVIPDENAIQLLAALSEFKRIYQNQIIGDNNTSPDNYLTEKQAAGYLKCSVSKIQIFRKHGDIQFFKFGSRIFYSQSFLDQFIESNTFGPYDGGMI